MSWLKSNGLSLAVGVTSKRYGNDRVLGMEMVTPSDLLPARDQTFLDGLRAGSLPPDLYALETEVLPGENEGRDRLGGYYLQMSRGKETFRSHFKVSTLGETLTRLLTSVVKQELLGADDDYDVFLTSRPQDETEQRAGHGQMQARPRQERVWFEPAPLSKYIAESTDLPGPTSKQLALQEKESKQMPLFVPEDVWQEGRELARLGGEDESAAVAVGEVRRDVDSPELFVVIHAFLQAEFATEEKFSVTFSGETWDQVRTRLEQRRRRLNRPQEIIVGSVHGHNFQPEADESGRRTCDACRLLEVCSRSTAVASTDDFRWHRSVFAGQPWANNLLIWGWNAREEEEWRMYGLEDATLTPRPVRLLKSSIEPGS